MSTIVIPLSDAPAVNPVASAATKPQALPPKPELLIVASADGHIEVFSNRPIRVHVAQRVDPDSVDDLVADDYLNATLPAWARDIYLPWNLATCYTVRPRTADDELRRRLFVDLVRCAADIRATPPKQIPVEVRP
jgi:hypothetical protein